MTEWIEAREERWNQKHPLYIKHHVTRSRNAGSLGTTREKGRFLSDITLDFPFLSLFFSFRRSDSPRNVVDRYVISPHTIVSNVSRRRRRRHRHSIGAFVIKDATRDPFRASAVARLLPMLADYGTARGNRAEPTMSEDRRTEPSAADSTGWNARRKPAGIGIGIGCSAGAPPVRRQSKANDRTARSSFLRAVEALKTAIIYVYYPSSPFVSRPRYPVCTLRGVLNSRRFESMLNRASVLRFLS